MGIKLTFPDQLRIVRSRRHYRAVFMPSMGINFQFQRQNENMITGEALDISTQGMAFRYDTKLTSLAENDRIRVFIDVKNFESIQLAGVVRSVIRMTIRDPNHKHNSWDREIYQCGIQFDLVNARTAAVIEELVVKAQREKIRQISSRRASILHNEENSDSRNTPSINRSQIEDMLRRFF